MAQLGALLGNARAAGDSEELKSQIEELKKAVAHRDEELQRLQSTMSTLRHAFSEKKEEAANDNSAAGDGAAGAAASEAATGGESAAAAGGGDGNDDSSASAAGLKVVSEDLGKTLAEMNTARMEAAKERLSFADRKAFKDPVAWAANASGRLVGVASEADGTVCAVAAIIKNATWMELKYVAISPGCEQEEACRALLVQEAGKSATEAADCEGVMTLFNGSMSDAEARWSRHGFKVNGVGPAPDYAVRLTKGK